VTNLADTFPFTGTVPATGFPAHIGVNPPANPNVGSIWFNPTTGAVNYYTSTGWVLFAGGSTNKLSLKDLLDVDAAAALDGDTLIYDASTGFWMSLPPDHDAGRY
jgi:hypothetical protein